MCLFLTALLRDDRISLDDYGIEIRGFCVRFLWVVEAADVLYFAWKKSLTIDVSTAFLLKLRVRMTEYYDIGLFSSKKQSQNGTGHCIAVMQQRPWAWKSKSMELYHGLSDPRAITFAMQTI